MEQLSKPLTTKQVVCHNGKSVYHFMEVTPNLVVTSGQPFMEVFDTKEALSTKIKPEIVAVEIKAELDNFVLSKDVEIKEVIIIKG